jgi:hypothetical protein
MKPVTSSPRPHSEGYAVNVYASESMEIKLAQVYGATPAEAEDRAGIVRAAFQRAYSE